MRGPGCAAARDWEHTAGTFLSRLRRDLANDPGNEELGGLTARLEAKAGLNSDRAPADALLSPVLTVTFLRGQEQLDELEELEFFSMIASIGHAQDVGLSGLHVETFIPANPTTRAAMEAYLLQH